MQNGPKTGAPDQPSNGQQQMTVQQAMALGLQHHQAGRLTQAERIYQQVLQVHPNHPAALHLLGVIAQQVGKITMAVELISRAVAIQPNYAEAQSNLGNALRDSGQPKKAIASYQRAIAINPDIPEVHVNLGNVLRDLGRLEESLASYQRAITLKPDYAEAHVNLGHVQRDLGQWANSAESCHKAIAINPEIAEAYNALGNAQRDLKQLEESVLSYRKAVTMKADYAEAYSNLGNVLAELGRLEEAIENHRQALTIRPDLAELYSNLGNAQRDLGQLEESVASFRKAISINPHFSKAYSNLALHIKQLERGDTLFALLKENLKRSDLSRQDQINFYYSAGVYYAEIEKEYDQAFYYYDKASRAKRGEFDYKLSDTQAEFNALKGAFSPEVINSASRNLSSETTPLFIVGMPRSGTTLVEQILASHPHAHGAGELGLVKNIINRYSTGSGQPFPQWVGKISEEKLHRLGQEYTAFIAEKSRNAPFCTDKMPSNFKNVGFISMAMPHARIIHVKRNPIDTCLSCFLTLFTRGQGFSYNLREVGLYYREYVDLMKHWLDVISPEVMTEVEYEALVDNQEEETRRLLSFCGLEWHPDCLDFHKTKRPVQTASVDQVRRPIYKSSIARWRPYRKHLDPLFEALGDLIPDNQEEIIQGANAFDDKEWTR